MLNLKKSDGIWISNTHEVFKDSEFENFTFQIKIQQLTKSQLKQIRKECQIKNGLDEMLFTSKVFMLAVLDWKGLKDQDNKEIKFSEENKKLIDDECPLFSSRVSGACLNDIKQKEKELDEQKKI